MRLALIALAVVALSGCQTAPSTPFVKGPAHAFNGQRLAAGELSDRELIDQRGHGYPTPRARIAVPAFPPVYDSTFLFH